ncbi:MAG: TolC family protein, partial [Bacteroidota bacterium]
RASPSTASILSPYPDPMHLRLLVIAVLLAAAPLALAQETRTISFDEAVRIALDQNVRLQQAELTTRSADLDVSRQRAQMFLPNISASMRPSQQYGLAFNQTTGQLENETTNVFSADISGSVNVFNGFADQAGLAAARLRARSGALSEERTRQDIVFEVASRYLQVLLDEQLVAIQEEAVEAERVQVERIQSLVDAGARPAVDVLRQEALAAERELGLLRAQNAATVSATQLVQTLQLDPFGTYTFSAPPLEALEATFETFDLDELLRGALDARDDLRAQELEIEALGQDIKQARAGYLPSVVLFAGYGSSYASSAQQVATDAEGNTIVLDPGTTVTTSGGDIVQIDGDPFIVGTQFAFEDTPFSDQFFDTNRGGNIGFSVNIPIFDRFQTRTQVQQAQIRASNARLTLESLEQSVALEVRQAYLDYQNAARALDVSAVQVESAEAALSVEQERYEFGASTFADLAQARAAAVQAQSDRAQAIYTFFFRRRLLDYALGALDFTQPLFE